MDEYQHSCSFAYFAEYVVLFLDDMWMKNVSNLEIAKVQPGVWFSFRLIFFFQFQPGVAYENKRVICFTFFRIVVAISFQFQF